MECITFKLAGQRAKPLAVCIHSLNAITTPRGVLRCNREIVNGHFRGVGIGFLANRVAYFKLIHDILCLVKNSKILLGGYRPKTATLLKNQLA